MAEPTPTASPLRSSPPPPPPQNPDSEPTTSPTPRSPLPLTTATTNSVLSDPPAPATSGWYSWSGRRGGNSQAYPPPPRPPPPNTDQDVVSSIIRRGRLAASLRSAAIAARCSAALLCLAALSVLGADRHKGWALDSYDRYTQFRYSEAVNVIGFLYSVFQLYVLVEHMRKQKHVIPRPEGKYFDFAMDQILAYLLISASSSATARVGDWVINWGSDPFPNMANGSIAISFLAFLAFAVSSLISAHNLFSRDL